MGEICTTEYAFIGTDEDVKKLHKFIIDRKAPEDAPEKVKAFFSSLRDWGITMAKEDDGRPAKVYFTTETKYSPDHENVGAAVYACVGHRMDCYYNSWCVGCTDYRTNDREGIAFDPSKYVWDFDGQDDFTSEESILERASKTFERTFTSIDDVNEYSQTRYGRDVIYPYQFEEPDIGWDELEQKTFRVVYIKSICEETNIRAKNADEAKVKWEAEGDDADLFFIEDEEGSQFFYS